VGLESLSQLRLGHPEAGSTVQYVEEGRFELPPLAEGGSSENRIFVYSTVLILRHTSRHLPAFTGVYWRLLAH